MKEYPVEELTQPMLTQLPQGAFLTVKDSDGKINTMTIGWGSVGYIWGKMAFMVMVRRSRYTYQLMEQAQDFTISFPAPGQMRQELAFCGTQSGRVVDKFTCASLQAQAARQVNSPVVGGCDIYLECRLSLKSMLNEGDTGAAVLGDWYPNGDLHMLYFGEIVACYRS